MEVDDAVQSMIIEVCVVKLYTPMYQGWESLTKEENILFIGTITKDVAKNKSIFLPEEKQRIMNGKIRNECLKQVE